MFARNFHNKINEVLAEVLGRSIIILNATPVSGGSINRAYRLETNTGDYFLKTNEAKRYPNMFKKEVKGLNLLRATNAIKIPEIIAVGEFNNTSYLVLEYIDSGSPSHDFWKNFGKQLAQLHQHTQEKFGLDHDNYIGSLHQSNQQHQTWTDFFVNERINPQIKLARDHNQIDLTTISRFEHLYKRVDEIFPLEQPALLHGDLWSGNFMVGKIGEAVILDPAVYYGHREMDLAMTKLFGGFDAKMYQAYHEHYPLAKGWEQRLDIYNLYPLMVHVNLFGGGYFGQVKSILSQF